ncbi:hypothetical protein KVV02_004402 [Mortierella alpina]|uniref:HTH cro/C1-type domain-containing protein n=1 Tax=Mortierella alpina TaxID=64518 RepID=A0A9P7ZZH0_MORAP|nr:hypothetical protein KVV02_004402 [Mortierella alpina]
MKLERWAKKLLKSSSSLPHSSKPCPTDATPPSRRSLEQSYPSSWSTQSACTRQRHKTFFGFSTRNASLGSLLSVAYSSGMTDPSLKHHHISNTNVSSTTINFLGRGTGKDREDVMDEKDKEPETTTLYYHPPPPHAGCNQQQVQADETREDGEQRRLMQVQLDEEAKKLARRRLARLGHLPEARASAKDVSSSSQRRLKVCPNVDGESRGENQRPVCQTTSRGVHSTRNRSESLPPPPCPRSMSKANTGTPRPDLLDFLDLTYLPYQPGHGTQRKQKQKKEPPRPEPSSLLAAYPTDRQRGGDDLSLSVRHSIDTINKLRASIVGLTAAFGDLTPATLSRPNTSLHPGDFDRGTSCVFGTTGSSSQGRTCPCNNPMDSDAVELPLPLGLSHPIAIAPVLKQLGPTLPPLSAPQGAEFKGSSSTIAKVQRSSEPNYEQLVKIVHTLNSSVDDLSRKIARILMLERTTKPHRQQQRQSRHISEEEEEDSSLHDCSPQTTFLLNGLDVEAEPLHSAPTKWSASCSSSKTTMSTASPSRNHPQGVIVRPDWFPPPPHQALPSIPMSEPSVATTARHPRRCHVQPPLQQQQQQQQQRSRSAVVTTHPRKQTDTTKAALALELQLEEAQCQTFLPPKRTTTSSSPCSPTSSQVVTPLNSCSCQSLGETKTRRLGQAVNKPMAVTTTAAAAAADGGGGEDRSPDLIHVIGLIESRLTVLRSEWPQLFFRDPYGHQTSKTTYGSSGGGSAEEEEDDDGLDKPLDTQLQAMVRANLHLVGDE